MWSRSRAGFASWNLLSTFYFFRKGARGGRGRGPGASPAGCRCRGPPPTPTPTPWPTARRAAPPGGAGREGGAPNRPYEERGAQERRSRSRSQSQSQDARSTSAAAAASRLSSLSREHEPPAASHALRLRSAVFHCPCEWATWICSAMCLLLLAAEWDPLALLLCYLL
jgi:hypothetical protein